MQSDNIIEKARQLGLDTGNSSSSADNLRTIASQVGLNNFNSLYDLGKLEGILDQKLSDAARNKRLGIGEDQEEAGGGETTPIRNNKFGQAAYDRAKGKNGVYDPEYYKKKQQKLDEKADKLNQERKNKTKLNKGETKPKADGSNTTKKSKMDRVMDNLKFAKAKKDAITNKIDGAKASAYNALHPVEHAKNIAKAKAKEKAKAVSKKAKAKAKAVAASVGKKILAFIAANPWILLVIGGLILLIFLILSIIALGGEEEDGYYNKACDFNSAPVHLTICNTEDEQVIDLKKYVLGSTASLIGDLEFSDDALKAIMIIMKTNALSLGNYNNAIKDINLDTCTLGYTETYPENYEDLYADIENYLYLSSIYNDEITNLSLSNYLVMDEGTLISIKANENIDLVIKKGKDLRQLVYELDEEFLDRLIKEKDKNQRKRFSTIIDRLSKLDSDLRQSPRPAIVLKSAIIELCMPVNMTEDENIGSSSVDANLLNTINMLSSKISSLESELSNIKSGMSKVNIRAVNEKRENKESILAKPKEGITSQVSKEEKKINNLPDIAISKFNEIDEFKKKIVEHGKLKLYSALAGANIYISEEFVLVITNNSFAYNILKLNENLDILANLLASDYGIDKNIRVELKEEHEDDISKIEKLFDENNVNYTEID